MGFNAHGNAHRTETYVCVLIDMRTDMLANMCVDTRIDICTDSSVHTCKARPCSPCCSRCSMRPCPRTRVAHLKRELHACERACAHARIRAHARVITPAWRWGTTMRLQTSSEMLEAPVLFKLIWQFTTIPSSDHWFNGSQTPAHARSHQEGSVTSQVLRSPRVPRSPLTMMPRGGTAVKRTGSLRARTTKSPP